MPAELAGEAVPVALHQLRVRTFMEAVISTSDRAGRFMGLDTRERIAGLLACAAVLLQELKPREANTDPRALWMEACATAWDTAAKANAAADAAGLHSVPDATGAAE